MRKYELEELFDIILIRKKYIKDKRHSCLMKTISNEFYLSNVFMFFWHPQLSAANTLLWQETAVTPQYDVQLQCEEFWSKTNRGIVPSQKESHSEHVFSWPKYYRWRPTILLEWSKIHSLGFLQNITTSFFVWETRRRISWHETKNVQTRIITSFKILFLHPYTLLQTNIY